MTSSGLSHAASSSDLRRWVRASAIHEGALHVQNYSQAVLIDVSSTTFSPYCRTRMLAWSS